jgi:hypothetical protein
MAIGSWQLAKTKPLKPTPISTLMSQVHAILGWVGEGAGTPRSGRAGDPVIGKAKPSQPCANRGSIAEVHANLGWIGMTTAQTHAVLG